MGAAAGPWAISEARLAVRKDPVLVEDQVQRGQLVP
jgi:hypothetical protein